MGKKLNAKAVTKWLSDNAIIVMIILAAIFTSTQNKNFYSINNIRNLLSNTAVRFIIACGVSGCLITKGTDLSAGRTVGLAACLSGIMMQKASYGDKFYPNLPELPMIVVLLGVMVLCGVLGGALLMWPTMTLVQHKTRRKRFMIGFPIIALVHVAIFSFLWSHGELVIFRW